MRIPIPIIFQRKSQRVDIAGKCPACAADRGFTVDREQLRVWLVFLPLGAQQMRASGACKACGAPATAQALRAARAPFWFRHGWLFFVLLPLATAGAVYYVSEARQKAAFAEKQRKEEAERRQEEADKKDRRAAEEACKKAYEEAKAAKAACFATINDAMNQITKDVDKEKPRAPADLAALRGLPVSVIGDPGVPEGPLFGGSPCPLVLDPAYELGGMHLAGYSQQKPVDDIKAKTVEMTAATKALSPAERWAVVTFSCTKKECISTAAWIDRKAMTLLAVARVRKPRTGDESADKQELERLLAAELATWK